MRRPGKACSIRAKNAGTSSAPRGEQDETAEDACACRAAADARRARRGPGAEDRPRLRADLDRPALPQSRPEQRAAPPRLRGARRAERRAEGPARARELLARARRDHLGVQAAAEREVLERRRAHREGRDLHLLPRADGRELALVLHLRGPRLHGGRGAGPAYRRDQDRKPAAARAEQPRDDRHPFGQGERRRERQVPRRRLRRASARRRNRSTSTIRRKRSAPAPTGSPTTRAARASSSSGTTATGAARRTGRR